MANISIQKKLAGLAAVPLCAFICSSLVIGWWSWRDAESASLGIRQLAVLKSSSALINELQRERGQSSGFVSGADNRAELERQRSKSDENARILSQNVLTSSMPVERRARFEKLAETLRTAREMTDRKAPRSEVIPLYSGVINELLQLEIVSADAIRRMDGVIRASLVEVAKENAGKLRANVTGILAADRPIPPSDSQTIILLRTGVDVSLRAPAISTSPMTKQSVQTFLESSNWKEVMSVYDRVLAKASEGGFATDSKAFFNLITRSIDELDQIIQQEFAHSGAELKHDQDQARKQLVVLSVVLLLTLVAMGTLLTLMIRSLSGGLKSLIQGLAQSSEHLTRAEESLVTTNEKLLKGSEEASGSLQKTSESMTEVTRRVEQNSTDADNAQRASQQVYEISQQGIEKMNQAVQAMEEILSTNARIQELVKVVSDIGARTQVIHDIVFQTQLLSFNASVEAARAGEHGKGFAVVAEEVGNLAEMSGNSAQEISAIVGQSTKKAEEIATESKDRVDRGHRLIGETAQVLKLILERAQQVTQSADRIAQASRDQQAAIQEATSAISLADHITRDNSTLVTETKAATDALEAQSRELDSMVQELRAMVE